MVIGDREKLIARISQVRRLAKGRGQANTYGGDPPPGPPRDLEARVEHLEQLLEGLQDSVHRESERHAKLIADLQAQVRPEAMGAALAEAARNRGV